MKKLYTALTFFFLFLFTSQYSFSQGTWDDILVIFRTECDGGSCHVNGDMIANLNFDGTPAQVLASISGTPPTNPYAKDSLPDQAVLTPGVPSRSFLLRKLVNCPPGNLLQRAPQEGGLMPSGRPALNDSTLELIRQWIIAGAPETGVVVTPESIQRGLDQGGPCALQNDLPTGVGELINEEIGFNVYPNPMETNTVVEFTLERSQHINLEVYNMLGSKVWQLQQSNFPAGKNNIRINGDFYQGVYVIQLDTEEGRAIKKVTVVNN